MIVISFYYLLNATFLVNFGVHKLSYIYFFFLSVNPFYYLYTRSITIEDYKIKLSEFLHFLPSILVLPISIVFSNLSEDSITILKYYIVFIYNAQVLVYTILMFVLLRRHNINIRNYFSFSSEHINLNWLKIFLVFYIIFSALDLLVYYMHSFENWELFYYLTTILFFNFLGYFGIRQINIYKRNQFIRDSSIEKIISKVDLDEIDKTLDRKSLLSEEKIEELLNNLKRIIKTDKIYKISDLSIFDVAKKLNINKTYISFVINKKLNENFSTFINRYRIEEAKNMLANTEFDNLTIEGIAKSVGFNSKSSFNSAFKKYIGITPSLFKKQSNI